MRRKGKPQKKILPVLIKILAGFALLLTIILVLHTIFKLETIEIQGANRYTEEEIKEILMQTKLDEYSLPFYLKNKLYTKDNIPFIDYMEVEMTSLSSVKIYVYEKIISGCVEVMGKYMYFDKDGIVVESSARLLADVPLVTGLNFDRIVLHEKLEVQKESLFKTILDLTLLINKSGLSITSIHFDLNYEVTLQWDGTTILLGRRDAYDEQINALKSILASSKEEGVEFDMRSFSRENPKVSSRKLDTLQDH